MKVLGPRILVEEEEPLDTVTARARAANLHIVLDEKNKPRATTGKIVQLGSDPLFEEWGLQVGTRITFGPLAGEWQWVEGKRYRLLEVHEVKMVLPPPTAS